MRVFHGKSLGRGRRAGIAASVAILSLTLFALPALADANWMGFAWTGPAALSGDDLVVTNDGSEFPAAHRNTSDPFRAQPLQSIEVSFIDSGNTAQAAPNVMLEDETAGVLTTFGGRVGAPNYEIVRFGDGGSLSIVTDTGVARSAGKHTMQIVKLPDGSVEYVLDGVLVAQFAYFGMDKFGDVYLRARGGTTGQTVTYTYHAESDEYERPLPRTPLSHVWFFGDCEAHENSIDLSIFGSEEDCRGFGLFFGAHNAATLNAAIRNELLEETGNFNSAVVTMYAMPVGAQFVPPIIVTGGSCENPAPFVPGAPAPGIGNLWIAWFTVEICDTSVPEQAPT